MYWLVIISEMFVSLTMAFVYIPVFYKLEITSSYEYLKLRFGQNVRILGSCLFIVKMMLYIPIVIYVPALAFSQVTGVNLHIITPLVCVICIFYTTLGGLKAVVWTDTVQMGVMVLGMLATIWIGIYEIGFANIIKRNRDSHRIEFDIFDLDPTVRHSFWTLSIGNYFYWLASCSVNQAMVQRCLAMPSQKKANIAIFNLAIGIILLVSMCCFTGLVVSAYFYDCDPLTTKKISKSDQILPYFIMEVGSKIPGLPGVFLSGVFSAALSTMSTGLNSLTGVILQDIIRPAVKKPISEGKASFIMKIIVVSLGAFCVAMVFVVEHLGTLIQAGKSLASITAGPLLGLFTLGMLFPWANSKGAIAGGISGLTVVSILSVASQTAIARGHIVYEKKPISIDGCSAGDVADSVLIESSKYIRDTLWVLQISYLYYTLIGMVIALVVGMVVSYLTGFNDPKKMDKNLFAPAIQRFINSKS
ncbi:sodium-coupled monocarboxylate transporter 2-like isoform X2 [Cimex lectularius]|nr:sodium-coupled monocarboxylate transporter 2-like isoform X2 [Cimex lectularius]